MLETGFLKRSLPDAGFVFCFLFFLSSAGLEFTALEHDESISQEHFITFTISHLAYKGTAVQQIKTFKKDFYSHKHQKCLPNEIAVAQLHSL